jgi:hypothetical protein
VLWIDFFLRPEKEVDYGHYGGADDDRIDDCELMKIG